MDILAIGDTVIDNFIRLLEAQVHCKVNTEDCEICMRWGDKIPFDFNVEVPAVGNAANAAVAAARLGLSSGLRAYVGEDVRGEQILTALKKEGVDGSLIEIEKGKHTNYHFVLWFMSERTILIKHEQFEYSMPQTVQAPKWLYLSSLGENSLPYHAEIAAWLAKNPEVKLAFQPGTFQMKFGTEALKDIYTRAEIFFCNKEEAQRILKTQEEDPKALMKSVQDLGPRVVVVTDGRSGAYAMDENDAWFIPMYPDPREPYERTGAGDAFAASVTSALAQGLPLTEALLWGPINAMEVVQKIGAQEGLLTREQLEKFLQDAPAEYKLRTL